MMGAVRELVAHFDAVGNCPSDVLCPSPAATAGSRVGRLWRPRAVKAGGRSTGR